jgi:hypothetical protein
MPIGEIHENDIGVALRGTFKDQDDEIVNIALATTKQIIIHQPGGDVLTKSGSFVTDGTDGLLQYVTVDGDLTPTGWYKIQGFVIIGSTQYHSDIHKFQVHGNL